MKLLPTALEGVLRVEPQVHRDARGNLFEVFHRDKFAAQGLEVEFVQVNQSTSCRGSLRGLHLQGVEPQGKLVRTLAGEIFDVAVDVRVGSPSFGRWVGAELTSENREMLWIPPGFAHGFYARSDEARVEYYCTSLYRPDADLTIRWNDPAIGIEWPTDAPLLSPKDAAAPLLAELIDRLPQFAG